MIPGLVEWLAFPVTAEYFPMFGIGIRPSFLIGKPCWGFAHGAKLVLIVPGYHRSRSLWHCGEWVPDGKERVAASLLPLHVCWMFAMAWKICRRKWEQSECGVGGDL